MASPTQAGQIVNASTVFHPSSALLTPFGLAVGLISQLNEDCQDTWLALKSDLYLSTLEIYSDAKAANRGGAYDAFLALFKTHFARPRRTPVTPP